MKQLLTFIVLISLAAAGALRAQSPGINIIPEAEEVASGEVMEVDITVSDFKDLVAWQFAINWDADVLHFVEVLNVNTADIPDFGTSSFGNPQIGAVPRGSLNVLWFSFSLLPVDLDDDTRLFTIRFLGLSCGSTVITPGSNAHLQISIVNADEEEVSIDAAPATVAVSAADCESAKPHWVNLSVDSASALLGVSTCVKVKVDTGFERIEQLQFGLGVSHSSIRIDSILPNASAGFAAHHFDMLTAQRFSVDWSAPSALTLADGTTLFEICFTGSQNRPGEYIGLSNPAPPVVVQEGQVLPSFIDVQPATWAISQYTPGFQLNVDVKNAGAAVGGNARVPIIVNGFSDIVELKFRLCYDEQHLRFLGASSDHLPGLIVEALPGSPPICSYLAIRYISEDGQGITLPAGETVLELIFEVQHAGESWLRFRPNPQAMVSNGGYIAFQSSNGKVKSTCEHPDCGALLALYESTNGPEWRNNTGWRHGATCNDCDPCTWYGITCNEEGRVICIDLDGEVGCTSDSHIGIGLDGELPEEIGRLPFLEKLFLRRNRISGSIPASLGELERLRELDLASNRLTGPIPPEVGNLASLEVLVLNWNQLSGEIPGELGQLSQLKRLSIDRCQLSGPIPVELFGLTQLEELSLDGNQLNGPIPPAIANLTALSRLNLGVNQFEGSIPSEIGTLSNLELCDLSRNNLSGLIPVELANLHTLKELSLFRNQLSGPIPAALSQLGNLVKCNLSGNPLGGNIPVEFASMESLEDLSVAGAQLSGPIPPELGQLPRLKYLDLNENQLSGELPIEFANLSELEVLSLNENELHGPIPEQWSSLTNLRQLDLSDNNLSGTLPVFFSAFSKLSALLLSRNHFEGLLPSEWALLPEFHWVFLDGNQLTGTLPAAWANLSEWVLIDLRDNQLSGCFPDSFIASEFCEQAEFMASFEGFGLLASGNLGLPWDGDILPMCQGDEQIGAPCGSGASFGQQILPDCSCGFPGNMPLDLPMPLGPTPSLVPNPSNGQVRVLLPAWDEPVNIRIIGADGRMVFNQLVATGEEIDLSGQPAGLYLVEIRAEGNAWIEKLVLLGSR
jgi:Leucine-rich repeat (LRR) protein